MSPLGARLGNRSPLWARLGIRGPPWAWRGNNSPPWAWLGNRSPLWAEYGNRSTIWARLGIWGPPWARRGKSSPPWAWFGIRGPPWARLHKSPEKIKAIMEASTPANVSQLRSFLGMINYYGRFIPNMVSVLNPLNTLLCKEKKWYWWPVHNHSKKQKISLPHQLYSRIMIQSYPFVLPVMLPHMGCVLWYHICAPMVRKSRLLLLPGHSVERNKIMLSSSGRPWA